ncbi:MAG: hypothetical protein J0I45_00345 [Bosea sp.]|nr:hypothetical protein [Bosea sp. (in: a-proteobacteria)]
MTSLSSFTAITVASAAAFTCPRRTADYAHLDIFYLDALLPVSNALDDPDQLDAAIDKLRSQYFSNGAVIDGLIGAYCPIVAQENIIDDVEKTALLQSFSDRVTRIVYSFQNTDAIILNVPFDPVVVDAINARAKSKGLSPSAWIAQMIGVALRSSP